MEIKRIDSLTLWAGCLIVILSGCSSDETDQNNESKGIEKLLSSTQVTITPAIKKNFKSTLYSTGKITPTREVSVLFETPGLVSELLIKNGQFVKKGEVIARINDQKYQLEFQKAEVQLKEKRLQFEDQMIGFENQTRENLDIIRENVKFTSGLASAEIVYLQAKLDLEKCTILAPLSGVVSNLDCKAGNLVVPGSSLCLIHDQGSLEVSCEIIESEALRLSIGQSATIAPLFDKANMADGRVSAINPRVDNETGLVKVDIRLDGSKHFLPGMNMSIRITIPSHVCLIVPKEAIVARSGRSVVFTAQKGRAKWNFVETGLDNGKEVEIKSGLSAGENVITTNNLQLSNNALIEVITN